MNLNELSTAKSFYYISILLAMVEFLLSIGMLVLHGIPSGNQIPIFIMTSAFTVFWSCMAVICRKHANDNYLKD